MVNTKHETTLSPCWSVLKFWKINLEKSSSTNWNFSLQKSISKLIFAGYTGSKNQVQNRLKIHFIELDFSKLICQKSSTDQQGVWLTASKWISINWIDSLIQGSYHFCFRANLSVIFVWLNESDLTQIMALSMTFFMKSSPYNQFINSLFISNLRKNQTVMNLIFFSFINFWMIFDISCLTSWWRPISAHVCLQCVGYGFSSILFNTTHCMQVKEIIG